MAITISANANIVKGLFSGASSGSNSLFNSTDILGINYSDYASIKTGAYGKLLSAYYSLDDTKSESSENTSKKTYNYKDTLSTSTSKVSTEKLAAIEKNAEKAKEATDVLLEQGSKSVFKQTISTDKEGNTISSYDTDKIYNAVKDFTNQYNALLNSTKDSEVAGVNRNLTNMLSYTSQNAKTLETVGITVNAEDNTLSVDEKAFKETDMAIVKALFNGTSSYAYKVAVSESMIDYYAEHEASKANTYTNSGTYSNNYNSGNMWDSVV